MIHGIKPTSHHRYLLVAAFADKPPKVVGKVRTFDEIPNAARDEARKIKGTPICVYDALAGRYLSDQYMIVPGVPHIRPMGVPNADGAE